MEDKRIIDEEGLAAEEGRTVEQDAESIVDKGSVKEGGCVVIKEDEWVVINKEGWVVINKEGRVVHFEENGARHSSLMSNTVLLD